jgi:hypothetical protein
MTIPDKPNAQECKARAIRAMERLQEVGRDANALSLVLQTAQVWATLATVPEPLEIVSGELMVDKTPVPEFPVLTCPHGYQAMIITIEAEGQPVQLRYTWNTCPSASCP